MLQQTRVETVKPYFERFMARFPTPVALAEAPEDQVLAAWSGLGYYRRARLLHAGARAVAERSGRIPTDREGLLELPGVGRYTAGAVASIAFERAVGLVDGNVARVFARLFGLEDDMKRAGLKMAEKMAEQLVFAEAPGDWNQALMELGATICTPRSPSCDRCPVASLCRARHEGREHELPILGEKVKPKPLPVQALVARARDGRVLLARRRSDGLFGGLWEPPAMDGSVQIRDEFLKRFTLDSSVFCGQVTHVLSHRRMTVDVHSGVLSTLPRRTSGFVPFEPYEAFALFEESGLGRLGVSKLARKVLEAAARAGDPGPLFADVELKATQRRLRVRPSLRKSGARTKKNEA